MNAASVLTRRPASLRARVLSLARSRRLHYLLLIAAALAVGWPTLTMPLHSDQATFTIIGQTIAAGRAPYVDAWDVKTPGVFLVYAAAIQGPFDVMRNVRAFDLLCVLATALLIYEVGRRWWNPRAALIAALIYGVVSVTDDPFTQRAQPDSLLALPLVLALLLYEASGRRRARLLGAGLALGFGVQLRFAPLFWVPALPLLEALAAPPGGRLRLWLDRMAWLVAGFVAANLAVLLYLTAVGALGEYAAAMRYAGGYTRLGGPWNPEEGPTLRDYLDTVRLSFPFWALSRPALTLPPLAGALAGVFLARDRRVTQLVLLALGSYACIAFQAKFFWYHFGHMVPILALLGGWTWDRFATRLRQAQPPLVAGAGVAVAAGGLLLMTPPVLDNGWHQWVNALHYHGLNDYGPYAVDRQVADYVRERTGPADSIYIWGFDPLIYVLAERPHASRFIVSFPLMSDWAPKSWRQGFIEELERNRPVYILVERGPAGSWFVGHNVDKVEYLHEIPAFEQLLAERYQVETEFSDRILYRRLD